MGKAEAARPVDLIVAEVKRLEEAGLNEHSAKEYGWRLQLR